MNYNPAKVAAVVVGVVLFTVAAQNPDGALADVLTSAMAWLLFAALAVVVVWLLGLMVRRTVR